MDSMVKKYEGTYFEQIIQPVVYVAEGKSPQTVIEASLGSRRSLSFAYFALGIDALAKRDPRASEYFKSCEQDGISYYYVTHISRALAAKLDRSPTWPEWISNPGSPSSPKSGN